MSDENMSQLVLVREQSKEVAEALDGLHGSINQYGSAAKMFRDVAESIISMAKKQTDVAEASNRLVLQLTDLNEATISKNLEEISAHSSDIAADVNRTTQTMATMSSRIDGGFDRATDRLDMLRKEADNTSDSVRTIDANIVQIKSDGNKMMSDLLELKNDIGHRLDNLEDMLNRTSGTMDKICDCISSISDNINKINSSVSSLTEYVNDLDGKIDFIFERKLRKFTDTPED